MGQMDLPNIEPMGNKSTEEYLKYLANMLAIVRDEIDNLLSGRLSAENIRANSIETKNLKAGAVTADKISVTELSAISANLGTINAGKITSTAEINVGTDVNVGNFLKLGVSSYTGQKGITFSDQNGIATKISVMSGDLSITADGFITLTIGSSQGLMVNKKVTAPSFNATSGMSVNGVSVALSSDLSSLQAQINALNSRVSALENK